MANFAKFIINVTAPRREYCLPPRKTCFTRLRRLFLSKHRECFQRPKRTFGPSMGKCLRANPKHEGMSGDFNFSAVGFVIIKILLTFALAFAGHMRRPSDAPPLLSSILPLYYNLALPCASLPAQAADGNQGRASPTNIHSPHTRVISTCRERARKFPLIYYICTICKNSKKWTIRSC